MHPTKLLISTKFAPPRIGAKHVARTALLNLLARTQQRKLALVTGSAGYGKTTLLAQWRQSCLHAQAEVAWISLTSDDKGFADFCAVFFAALKTLHIDVELDMSFEGSSADAIEEAVTGILEGAAELPKELFLILDDYHHVADPQAHKLVQRLLDQCPANLHIVIASRAAPPLSLSRLRVMDQMIEVDCAALPFDAAETRSFLDGNLETRKVSADEASLIHELTGGWPSCLQLVVIMLKHRPGASARLRDLVWRSNDLQTYLSEEVMENLPAELGEFVETLSLFRRFNAPLAQAVTGNPHSAELLRRMELENLPIQLEESDDRSPWFRFHPLFAEFLNTRIERRGPAAIASLHGCASRWFASNDLLVEALRHASLAGDLELAASVIESTAPATWTLSYLGPVNRLLDRLPQEALVRHRRLFFLACVAIALSGRPAIAEARIVQLEASDTARLPEIAARLPLVHAVIALQRDDALRTIELLEPHHDLITGNPFLRYLSLSALACAYAGMGRYADARSLLDRHPIPPADQSNDMAIVAQSARVLALLLEGNAGEAERVASPLLARALKASGRRSVCANVCSAFAADAYYELDRIDDARETIANRHGLHESSGVEVAARAALCRARLDLLQESADAALAFLQQQATRFRAAGLDRAAAWVLAEQVKIYVLKGKSDQARAVSAMLDDLAGSYADGQGQLAEIPAAAALARARLALAAESALAVEALAEARMRAQTLGRNQLLVLIDLLMACALDDLGRADEAMESRKRAAQNGQRLGLVRTFLDEGALAHRELSLLAQGPALDAALARFVSELLERFPESAVPGGPTPAAKRAATRKGQAALTQREVEILQLVAQAMSNKRIALTLNITLETVKWNLRNIFAKLGVSSRYDAMIWARNQDLIR